MKFQVLCFDKLHMCHRVKSLDNDSLQPLYLDLTVDGTFPEYRDDMNLDGRIIEVSEVIPYVGLAVNVKLTAQ